MPIQFYSQPPAAKEYQLALITVPNDPHYAQDAIAALFNICNTYSYQYINLEYRLSNMDYVTLYGEIDSNKIDIGMLFQVHLIKKFIGIIKLCNFSGLQLIKNGHVLLENRSESRFKKLIEEYAEAETKGKFLKNY